MYSICACTVYVHMCVQCMYSAGVPCLVFIIFPVTMGPEWQLVSLSRDHSLRVWRLNEQIAQQLGQATVDPSAAREESLTSTLVPIIRVPEEETSFNNGPPPRHLATPTPTPSPSPPPPPVPMASPAAPHHQYSPKLLTLMQEFTLFKSDPPNLELERVSSSVGHCDLLLWAHVWLDRCKFCLCVYICTVSGL